MNSNQQSFLGVVHVLYEIFPNKQKLIDVRHAMYAILRE